jgi:hypothetical protein
MLSLVLFRSADPGARSLKLLRADNNENAAVYFLEGATSEKSPPRTVVDQLAPQCH